MQNKAFFNTFQSNKIITIPTIKRPELISIISPTTSKEVRKDPQFLNFIRNQINSEQSIKLKSLANELSLKYDKNYTSTVKLLFKSTNRSELKHSFDRFKANPKCIGLATNWIIRKFKMDNKCSFDVTRALRVADLDDFLQMKDGKVSIYSVLLKNENKGKISYDPLIKPLNKGTNSVSSKFNLNFKSSKNISAGHINNFTADSNLVKVSKLKNSSSLKDKKWAEMNEKRKVAYMLDAYSRDPNINLVKSDETDKLISLIEPHYIEENLIIKKNAESRLFKSPLKFFTYQNRCFHILSEMKKDKSNVLNSKSQRYLFNKTLHKLLTIK